MDNTLSKLIGDLQTEIEGIAVRGIKIVPVEQIRWMKSTEKQLGEMGAEFLAQKIERLLVAIEQDDQPARRMYDLLTTIKVFERVLTLNESQEQFQKLALAQESP